MPNYLSIVPNSPEARSVDERLDDLGLTVDLLHRAARTGLIARSMRTRFAPRNAPGTDLYSHTVEELRLQTEPLGWTIDQSGGQERTISPDGQFAIVVSTGDGPVGKPGTPRTAHPKGQKTRQAIVSNQLWLQESITGLVVNATTTAPSTTGPATVWIFLVKVEGTELVMELSLPDHFDKDGRPDGFADRILLPAIPLSVQPGSDADEPPSFDVPVERR